MNFISLLARENSTGIKAIALDTAEATLILEHCQEESTSTELGVASECHQIWPKSHPMPPKIEIKKNKHTHIYVFKKPSRGKVCLEPFYLRLDSFLDFIQHLL